MVVSGILFIATPPLVFHGVKTMVFLPKALAVNHAATEVLHQIAEGGFSSLSGQMVQGLRFAVRRSATEPALWLAEDKRIGFLTSGKQYVLIELDDSVTNDEVMKRGIPTAFPLSPKCTNDFSSLQKENLPYYASGSVRILQTPSIPSPIPVFRYYNQGGSEIVTPGCPPPATIRRVDIAFTAQTGNGNFDEGDAREDVASSVAIRVP